MRPDLVRIGVLTPHAAAGPEEELPAMAPGRVATRVVRVRSDACGTGRDPPATPAALSALTVEAVLDRAADELRQDPLDAVAYASTTSAYAIGPDVEAAMVARLERRVGVPVVATCQAAVLALRVLAVERLALIGAPWFDARMNELGAAYFRSQGYDVISSESAALSQDPARITAADVYEWTSRHVPDTAHGAFIGGNGFRAAGAIDRLETALERPVLTANQVLLWRALERADAQCEVTGFGRLFSARSPRSACSPWSSRSTSRPSPSRSRGTPPPPRR
jgi:maleate isomerase